MTTNYKRKWFLPLITVTIVTLITLQLASVQKVQAQNPRIYLEPSAVTLPETTPIGYLFNVTVKVENAPQVGGVQIYLEFNDSVINATRWFEPKTDSSYIFYGRTTTALPTPPNDPGYVHLAQGRGRVLISVSLFPPPPDQTPGQGNATICIFEFKTVATPTQPLSSGLKINFPDTYMLDPDGNEVPDIIKDDGTVTIIPEFSTITLALSLFAITAAASALRKKTLKSGKS
jgi:hypothetical protein